MFTISEADALALAVELCSALVVAGVFYFVFNAIVGLCNGQGRKINELLSIRMRMCNMKKDIEMNHVQKSFNDNTLHVLRT